MAVGDINSNAVGSGARYNDGKPPVELLPIKELAEYYAITKGSTPHVRALRALGNFQAGGDKNDLFDILKFLDIQWQHPALVFDFGRKKYAEWNWAKGMPWSVPIGCCARHLLHVIEGEGLDRDSGLPHDGHTACNVFMLLLYTKTYPEGDDRPVEWLNRSLAGKELQAALDKYDPAP